MPSKRANGEGTIFRRSDGRWVGEAYVLLPNGGRDRRTIYGRTRAEVHEKVTALVRQAQDGVIAPAGKLTVEQYLHQWLDEVVARRVRPRSLEIYEGIVRLHLVPGIGRKRLDRLTAIDVRRLLNAKADEGLAPGTVKKIHVVIGSALQQAVRDDLLLRNVARLVQVPVPPRPPINPLTVEEAQELLAAAHGDRLYALWAVALGLGLRKGEALGLRWRDVDLEACVVRVEQALQRSRGEGLKVGPLKTPRSRRTIPLPTVCARALMIHRARQNVEREAAGDEWQGSELVFTSKVGTPLEPRNVNRAFRFLCDKAGIRPVRVHDLRHTCASLLLAQGVPLRVVMEVLGHSQIALTANTYTHVLPVLQREAADLMDVALGGSVAVNVAVNQPENEIRDPLWGP